MTGEHLVTVPRCCDQALDAVRRDDTVLCYEPWTRVFSLRQGSRRAGPLQYCPWCGAQFPPSIEDEWTRRVTAVGGDPEFPELLPLELRSSRWWDSDTDVEFTAIEWPPDLIERDRTPVAVREQLSAMLDAYPRAHRLNDANVCVSDEFRSRRRDEYHFKWNDDAIDRKPVSVAVFVGEDADGEPLTCRLLADEARVLTASWLRNDGGACFPGIAGQSLSLVTFAFLGKEGVVRA